MAGIVPAMRKIALALLFALASASPALAAPCAAIPALPDVERRTEYTGVSSSTGPFNVSFQLYGDGSDYGNWLSVWVNGVQKTAVTDFTVTSPSGALSSLCLPITNAQVTFTVAQSGTIEIVGARRPRRTSQLSENAGVTAHAFNQLNSDIVAMERERWDLNARQLRGLPSETISPLASAATRAGQIFSWDAQGNPSLTSPSIGLGNVIGPAGAVNGHVAIFNGATGAVIADGGAISTTAANPTATVGCTTVNGSASTIMRSDGAPGLNLAASCTYTGNHTLAPTSGVALTVTGPSGLARALDVTQTVTGSDTVTHQINNFAITDAADLGANVGNGINIAYNYGSGTAKGSRQALQVGMTLTSATNAMNTKHFYAAGQFGAAANSGDNGANTGAGALGSIIALNPAVTLNNGATNLAEASGIQVNMFTKAGSSVSQRSGIEISDNAGAGGIQGATFDDAIVLGNVAGSPGWKTGIGFDCTNFGGCPLDSTNGRAIEFIGTHALKDILYAPTVTPSNSFITFGSKFVVDPSGNTQIAATSSFSWVGQSKVQSSADGNVLLTDSTALLFGRLQLGGVSASFPAIKRNGAAINFRLADDSNDAAITAAAGTFTKSSIGTTSTDGLILTNATAAGAGAQQYSPRLRLTGQGWRTNAGGSSQTVDWVLENQPVQSTASPLTNLVVNVQQNATGYSPHTAFIFGGALGGPVAPADSTQRFVSIQNSLGSALYGVDGGGTVYAWSASGTGGTLFGTAGVSPVDFWTNNVRRIRVDRQSTHVSFWNNTTGVQTNNTPPGLTSCGTTPAITAISSDVSGTVTMGTGTPAGCVITFNVAYTQAPICRVTWRINIASMQYTTSTTAITLTQTATSSNVVDYICDGS